MELHRPGLTAEHPAGGGAVEARHKVPRFAAVIADVPPVPDAARRLRPEIELGGAERVARVRARDQITVVAVHGRIISHGAAYLGQTARSEQALNEREHPQLLAGDVLPDARRRDDGEPGRYLLLDR